MEIIALEQLYFISQILAGIAVFISLIYVGYQVKQNTKAITLSTVHDICEGFRDQYQNISSDRQVADVFVRGLVDPDGVDGAGSMQFYSMMHELFRIYEDSFYQYKVH
ncbi:MAG: hypothetical protein ACE5GZ_07775 [Gammaproteobacteria bacterium]